MNKTNEGVIVSADRKISNNGHAYPAHRIHLGTVKKAINLRKAKMNETKANEGLDELSKTTLGNYIKKSSDSASKAKVWADRNFQTAVRKSEKYGSDRWEEANKEEKTASKRKAGISAAVSRLTKEDLDEAHKLGDRVKIVGGVSKDVIGIHGHIGEIRHGAYKGAPKTYTVDYQHPKHSSQHTSSIQLSKEHIRGAKSGTLGEDLDELSVDTLTSYAGKAREDASNKVKKADRQAKSSSSATLNKALQNYRDATSRNKFASKAETKARGKQIMDVNK